jgi:hypothetical protein
MKIGSIRIALSSNLLKNVSKYIARHTHIDMRLPLNCRSKTGRIKSEFRHDVFAVNCDVDLNTAGPVLLGSAVFGYNGEQLVKNMCKLYLS